MRTKMRAKPKRTVRVVRRINWWWNHPLNFRNWFAGTSWEGKYGNEYREIKKDEDDED